MNLENLEDEGTDGKGKREKMIFEWFGKIFQGFERDSEFEGNS